MTSKQAASEVLLLAWKGLPKAERRRVASRIAELAGDEFGGERPVRRRSALRQAVEESEAGVGVVTHESKEALFARLGL